MPLSGGETIDSSSDMWTLQLQHLQAQLEDLYDLSGGYPVDQFLVTDRCLSDHLDSSHDRRDIDEKLLIAQDDEGVAITLFLDEGLLRRLADYVDTDALDCGRLNDYCVALEGVSHFVYFTFKASHDRPVSRLELELQAEVDKYFALVGKHLSPSTRRVTPALRSWLFDHPSYDPDLSLDELNRYRDANELASKFCKYLEVRYLNRRRMQDCQRQLRRFYRLSERKKLDWIRST